MVSFELLKHENVVIWTVLAVICIFFFTLGLSIGILLSFNNYNKLFKSYVERDCRIQNELQLKNDKKVVKEIIK